MLRVIQITLFSALVVLFIASMGGQASAQLQMDLDVEFSGGTEPSGSGPWLSATFDNIDSDTVRLSMDASGLNGSLESIKGWYFNFYTLDATSLSFDYISGAQATNVFTDNTDTQLQANGDGYFDFQFLFADDTFGNDAGASIASVYDITYTSPITFNSFNYESTPDGGPGIYYTAAQVQDINGDNVDSGWVGASTTTIVPEPVSSTLFIVGGATLGFRRLRKKFIK